MMSYVYIYWCWNMSSLLSFCLMMFCICQTICITNIKRSFFLGSTDSFNDAIRHLLRFFLVLLLIIIIIISYKCSVYFMRLKNDEFYIFDVCFGSNSEFWIFCDFFIEKKIIVSFEYFCEIFIEKKIIVSFKYFTIRPVWIM